MFRRDRIFGSCFTAQPKPLLLLSVLILLLGCAQAQQEFNCTSGNLGDYNTTEHLAALFTILGVSLLGTSTPYVVNKLSRRQPRAYRALMPYHNNSRCSCTFGVAVFLKLGRAFGAGVILATAFVHMLAPAVLSLTSSCVPTLFNTTYQAFAGAFAMAAALLVQAVEFVATRLFERFYARRMPNLNASAEEDSEQESSSAESDGLSSHDEERVAYVSITRNEYEPVITPHDHSGHDHHSLGKFIAAPASATAKIMVLVLEFGIAVHSVIIGVGLGALRGDEFRSLWIALSFHQFFEGFALGATLVQAKFKTMRVYIFTLIWYSLMTPTGVAVGIAIAQTYNENSASTLLTQGIMDSVSAGILIYSALVEILTYQFTNSPEFRDTKRTPTWLQVLTFMCLYLGAGIMAFIGKYA
eukprot:TRINITY_DN9177_c0_g1_i2.p1 TRINITY_DN9177_c0_g1~~TRINITY_DN9177_c0_g1_i2.p1  ORF type:complete len:413 (-),score=75.75 TRINITY_DN9177_c0_g1_i2:30-1268(-)